MVAVLLSTAATDGNAEREEPVSKKSLMMLRTAIRSPEEFKGHLTGDADLDQLLASWSDQQREELRTHEANDTLARAVNGAFLSDRYSPEAVRGHEVLGPYIGHLSDEALDSMQAKVAAKRCQEQIQPG